MINEYNEEEGGSAKMVIDTVQRQLQCCGYGSMRDWRPEGVLGSERERGVSGEPWLPSSCCSSAPCTEDKAFIEPCKMKLRENALNPHTAIGMIGQSE